MKTTSHISFEKLADLAENRLGASDRAESLAHIAGCSRCANDFDRLGNVVALMKADKTEDAPRDLIAYANSIFHGRARKAQASVLKRIVAALTFDSLTATPAFGVRSGQPTTRQLLFSADESDLDLRIARLEDRILISGQVLGPACTGGRVDLEGASESKSATLNELCEFTLPAVPPGNYSLRLRLSDIEIEIPELKL